MACRRGRTSIGPTDACTHGQHAVTTEQARTEHAMGTARSSSAVGGDNMSVTAATPSPFAHPDPRTHARPAPDWRRGRSHAWSECTPRTTSPSTITSTAHSVRVTDTPLLAVVGCVRVRARALPWPGDDARTPPTIAVATLAEPSRRWGREARGDG